VDNIYDTCSAFIAHGVTINRPPRDARMAFIRTPDGISSSYFSSLKRRNRELDPEHDQYPV
jgi:hypothetical protein